MTPSERERALVGIIEMVEDLAKDLPAARTELRQRLVALPRIRAADPNAGGGGGHGGTGPSDSTGGSVASAEVEPVTTQLDRWDMWLEDSFHLLSKLVVETGKVLAPPEEAAPVQRRLNGCESCARHIRPDGKPYFEPVAFGRYAKYCRSCGEYFAAERELPPIGAVIWMHNVGRKWTTKVLAEAKMAARSARSRKGA